MDDNRFKEVWPKIQTYLKDGTSLIAVREKADSKNPTKYPAKTPCGPWKMYQGRIMSENELWYLLDKYDSTSTACVLGPISGNLCIFDFDIKYWNEIAVLVFTQIQEILPHLWKILRIIKTPSGGYHIPVRIVDHIPPGKKKLVYKFGQNEAGVELLSTGCYALNDTCLNYFIYKENPIPKITWSDFCSLMAIVESFNQKKKIETIKPIKKQSDLYLVNPWDDYNQKDGGVILSESGWRVHSENSKFIYFTRPGKTVGISASFNKETNVYFIFTSSSEFNPAKGYFPSQVLSMLKFNNDNKAVYRYLVDKGFGNLNREKELKIASNNARKKIPLPNNFSTEAKEMHAEITAKNEKDSPFGVFIHPNPQDRDGKLEVSRIDLYRISGLLGFRYFKSDIVRIEGHLVSKCTKDEYYNIMATYIKSDDPEEEKLGLNIWEKFIESHGSFSMSRLPELDTELLIKDNKQNAHLFFKNGFLHVTSEKIEFKDYAEFDMLVFKEKIRDRDWVETDETGIYGEYLENCVGLNNYTKSILGFLVHDYKDETTGFIPVLTEKCENPEDGGGSGKNVFCNLLSYSTTFVNKNCAGVQYDEKFFQIWTGQRIVALSDLPEHFNFLDLKDATTGSITHKRLFKDEVTIKVQDTPKFVCQTNYSVENVDGGIKRRIRLLEFKDFYTIAGGIDVHHGKHFPNDWTTEDWYGYDNIIAQSVQVYLKQGCKILMPEISKGGWLKRFKHSYGPTICDIIHIYFKGWVEKQTVKKEEFDKDLDKYYLTNRIQKKYEASSMKMNKALAEFCDHNDIYFIKDHNWSENNIKFTGRLFRSKNDEEGDTVSSYEGDIPF